MTLRPDYGLHILQQGISPDVEHNFYDFRLYNLALIARGQYSTMVDLPFDGQVFALSLDFNGAQLDSILSKASPQLRSQIADQIASDPSTPRPIDFDGEVSFGVRARLGGIQKAKAESFVPLVAQEIF